MNSDKPNKYANGKIYSIRSHQTDKYYIGSTCSPLHKRFYEHKAKYKRYLMQGGEKVSSFHIVKFDDCFIELIEAYPCNSKNELHRREGQLIRENKGDVVNVFVAGRTKSEYVEDRREHIQQYKKEYREENNDHIREYRRQYYDENSGKIKEKARLFKMNNADQARQTQKNYYENNKDKIARKQKEYVRKNKESVNMIRKEKLKCECGASVSRCHKARHLRTKTHQAYLLSINPTSLPSIE